MKTRDLVYIAMCSALIVICSWISIPAAVPFTMQTFAVFAALLLLGGKNGTIAVLVYILLGAVGLPVFSGFRGGPGVLLGTTGGYILGFVLAGLIFWAAEGWMKGKTLRKACVILGGLLVCYAFGSAWFMILYTRSGGAVSLLTVLGWCVFPFVFTDLVKMLLAFLLVKRVKRVVE